MSAKRLLAWTLPFLLGLTGFLRVRTDIHGSCRGCRAGRIETIGLGSRSVDITPPERRLPSGHLCDWSFVRSDSWYAWGLLKKPTTS